MRRSLLIGRVVLFLSCLLFGLQPCTAATEKAPAKVLTPNARMDYAKMSDMSDFDPGNPVIPTGDTIKIGVISTFSGPGAMVGDISFFGAQWVAHDINKRGGILVDGRKKLIQVIKADNMGTPDGTRKAAERMALQEKVHMFWGSTTSAMSKIMDQIAQKYKIISVNMGYADDMHDAESFSRYSFMTDYSAEQIGRGFAYFYGQIRKKERKFYIVAQDTLGGHSISEGFKKGLKEYDPKAQIVGEDYHKLFLFDFAAYLTKVKASGAEVIFNPSSTPDGSLLIKQAMQMGVTMPFAIVLAGDPSTLKNIGVEGTKGLVVLTQGNAGNPYFKSAGEIKFFKTWNELWKNKWKGFYGSPLWENPFIRLVIYQDQVYWAMSVLERTGSTEPEKIIKVWEGDIFQFANGGVAQMRACDHKAIHQLQISEFVLPEQQKQCFNIPPYYWNKNFSFYGPTWVLPTEKTLPWMDQNLDRCKGKNDWGE